MKSMAKSKMMLILFVVTVSTTTRTTEAQTQDCASKLVPCASYLKTTSKPPATCCNPIKEAVETQRDCLCNLYYTPGLLASFNVTVDDALRLTKNCGISADLSACKTASDSSPSSPPGRIPIPVSPAGKQENGVGRVACSGVGALLLFWGGIMLN